jgi:hypothetical protein
VGVRLYFNETRELFFGFRSATRPPKRWHELSEQQDCGTATPNEAAQAHADFAQADARLSLQRL